ncbi:glycoside hydrolase family 68 protein [Alteraurantiacibacter palmitatis]|uniref:Glycoside hydrolase family 68 protein n=1 Tax=Alteraurantiacibacter palmitatis TaxID=2054628 RepID=A0ABV7E3S1_9SPHN
MNPNSNFAPVITQACFARIAPDLDIWDAWPIQLPDGTPARMDGGDVLWMALGAPHFADPDQRHSHARIHLLQQSGVHWRHLGPAMPDEFSPGSREWSGSAILLPDIREVLLFFTATGRRGERKASFEQRIFSARATLSANAPYTLTAWRDLAEAFVRDPAHYMASDAGQGALGTIKAFRDPAYFRDPSDGASYLFFAGSAAHAVSDYNGVIGLAVAQDAALSRWNLLPPIVNAEGLNNELERPHVVHHGGRYYLFWSTQRHVFNPAGPIGPTGLYGMVSESIAGEWKPLNDTGLVFANPPTAPAQAYSWLVMPDLSVTSFVDDWGEDSPGKTRHFGASFAPFLQLHITGNRVSLV